MKRISTPLLLLAAFHCCLFIYSCKNTPHRHAAHDKKYHLGRQFSAASARYYYTINNESKTKLELNDRQTETINKSDIGMICEMHKDTAGRYLITLTYDTFHIVTGKNGDTQEISSLASSYDPAEKLLGSLKGMSLTVILDSPGHILSITGSQEVVRTIMTGMNSLDEHTAKQARELVARFTGDSFIKNNMEQLFEMLPDTAVYIGDTWTSKTRLSDDLSYESIANYTLTSVTDGVVRLESDAQINSGKESKINLMGYDVSTNLKGEQNGMYEVEERTGRVVKSRTETDIKL